MYILIYKLSINFFNFFTADFKSSRSPNPLDKIIGFLVLAIFLLMEYLLSQEMQFYRLTIQLF